MCLTSTPKMPVVQDPQRPQDVKQPEKDAFGSTSQGRKNASGAAMAGSTLLTGPSGIENSQLNIGKSTLLGM